MATVAAGAAEACAPVCALTCQLVPPMLIRGRSSTHGTRSGTRPVRIGVRGAGPRDFMTPRKPTNTKPGSERRREPRLRLSGEVLATVQTAFTASVLDLSIGGAQIDVAYSLKPGGPCVLGLTLPGDRLLKIYGRVLRSNLRALKAARGGEAVAHYRVAVIFDQLTDEQRAGIETLLLDFEGELDAEMAAELEGGRPPATRPSSSSRRTFRRAPRAPRATAPAADPAK